MAPDRFYFWVNRLNAVLSGRLLGLLGMDAQVLGVTLKLNGFRALVIGECSAIFLSVLLLGFILAYPSGWKQKPVGWIFGLVILFSINLVRMVLLVYVGACFHERFQLVHLYLGQTAMVLAVPDICLGWIKWLGSPPWVRHTGWRLSLSILLSLPRPTWPFC